ncbi:MAG: hypothetical protein IJ083_00810 [Clostridia bacterium]|nr:hypothetical protein [Clostridia bacterium]
MQAGFGKAEITPPLGLELAGYGYYLKRRARTVEDPLFARAVYLRDGDKQCLIVSCDLLGLSRQVVEAVKAGVGSVPVIIVSIHTHTGPAIKYHEGCGEVDGAYVETLPGRILKACREAMEDAGNVLRLEGVFGQMREAYVYNRACDAGPVDLCVRGFSILREGGVPIQIVSAASHAVCRGKSTGISADFPGEVVRLLETGGCHAIYLNGLCGDIDPVIQKESWQDTEEETGARRTFLHDMAASIAESFCQGQREILPHSMETLALPFSLRLMPVTREEIRESAGRAAARDPGSGAARVADIWAAEMMEKYDSLRFREEISIPVLLLGGRVILALPFEGFTAIGEKIRAGLHMAEAMALGCGEEMLGYLPTRDDIARGAYAALESTYLYKRLPVMPGEAERLGEEIARALHKSFESFRSDAK